MNKKGPKIDNYRKMRKKGNFHIFQKKSQKREVCKDDKNVQNTKLFFKKNDKKRRKKKRKKKKTEHTIISHTASSGAQNIHVMLSYANIGKHH